MCAATTCVPLRIAIGLSGGVDSAVTALVLQRCVHTTQDVAALRCFGGSRVPPPSLSVLQAAVDARVPLHQLLRELVTPGPPEKTVATDSIIPVHYTSFFMRNWHDVNADSGWCLQSQIDYDDAQRVAMTLGLLPRDGTPLPLYDFSSEYIEQCFERMLDAYAAGHTLNVDVLCNSKIKFGALMRELRRTGSAFSDTFLATGHYARTWDFPYSLQCGDTKEKRRVLLAQPCSAGRDLNDQTLFLSRVPPSALAKAIFPLGHLFHCKADVRALAAQTLGRSSDTSTTRSGDVLEHSVEHIPKKKTSTGICFVGPPSTSTCATGTSCSERFAAFLNDYLPPPQPVPTSSTPTVFRDALTGETLPTPRSTANDHSTDTSPQVTVCHRSRSDLLGTLRGDYPGCLPAYAFTLGQRIRLGLYTTDGHMRVESFYVVEKVLAPPPSTVAPSVSAPVRLLAEVRVVAQWNHELLYSTEVTILSLQWWLPLCVLHQCASTSLERNTHRLGCHCRTRHHEALHSGTVEWRAADEENSADGGVCVRRARIHLDTPMRAVTPGQALVVYISGVTLQEEWLKSHAVSLSDAVCLPLEAMVVIGCGWVAPSDTQSS